jgi:hypothetical protein
MNFSCQLPVQNEVHFCDQNQAVILFCALKPSQAMQRLILQALVADRLFMIAYNYQRARHLTFMRVQVPACSGSLHVFSGG